MRNFLFLILIFSTKVFAQLTNAQTQSFQSVVSCLPNGGFESGKGTWAVTGGTLTFSTTSPVVVGQYASWDSSAAAQIFYNNSYCTIPVDGYYDLFVNTKTAATDYKLQVYNGSIVLSEIVVPASTTWKQQTITVYLNQGTQIQPNIYSQSNAAVILFDGFEIRPSRNTVNVTNALTPPVAHSSLSIQGGVIATNLVQYSRIGSNMVISGNVVFSSVSTAEFRLSLPTGFTIDSTGVGTGNNFKTGSITRFATGVNARKNFLLKGVGGQAYLTIGFDEYATTDNPNSAQNTDTCFAGTDEISIFAEIPIAEWRESTNTLAQSVNPDQVYWARWQGVSGGDIGPITSGSYVTANNGTLVRDSSSTCLAPSSSGDISCKIPLLKAGTEYEICHNAEELNVGGSVVTGCGYQLYDGTNEYAFITSTTNAAERNSASGSCQIIKYSSDQINKEFFLRLKRAFGDGDCYVVNGDVASSINISVKPVKSTQNPFLTNSIVTGEINQTKMISASFATPCTSSPCALDVNLGNGVSSVTRAGTGDYTVNFAAAFASTQITCQLTSTHTSFAQAHNYDTVTASSIHVLTATSTAGILADGAFSVTCWGPK